MSENHQELQLHNVQIDFTSFNAKHTFKISNFNQINKIQKEKNSSELFIALYYDKIDKSIDRIQNMKINIFKNDNVKGNDNEDNISTHLHIQEDENGIQ